MLTGEKIRTTTSARTSSQGLDCDFVRRSWLGRQGKQDTRTDSRLRIAAGHKQHGAREDVEGDEELKAVPSKLCPDFALFWRTGTAERHHWPRYPPPSSPVRLPQCHPGRPGRPGQPKLNRLGLVTSVLSLGEVVLAIPRSIIAGPIIFRPSKDGTLLG